MLYSQRDDSLVMVANLSKFYVDILEANHQNTQTWMKSMYYLAHATSPDFRAIRSGSVVMAENIGFDWKRNFGVGAFQKMFTEISGVYPSRFRKLKNFHAGVFMNLILSMSKSVLPKEVYEKFEMGCTSPLGNLENIYMQPTVQAANERYLKNISFVLKRGYENRANFRL